MKKFQIPEGFAVGGSPLYYDGAPVKCMIIDQFGTQREAVCKGQQRPHGGPRASWFCKDAITTDGEICPPVAWKRI